MSDCILCGVTLVREGEEKDRRMVEWEENNSNYMGCVGVLFCVASIHLTL